MFNINYIPPFYVQYPLPAAEVMPDGQAVQLEDLAGAYVFAAQVEHALDSVLLEYFPAGQSRHFTLTLSGPYIPLPQLEHPVEPTVLVDVLPFPQLVQELEPALEEYLPEGHSIHVTEPSGLYFPAGH